MGRDIASKIVKGVLRVDKSMLQGVSGSLTKSWSLLLRLKSNLVAQTGDIFFFLLGHFDI